MWRLPLLTAKVTMLKFIITALIVLVVASILWTLFVWSVKAAIAVGLLLVIIGVIKKMMPSQS